MIVEKYSLLPEYNLATIFAMDNILSTQGIMVMLLVAYGLAMWTFLTNAPKVYTVMVSDIKIAQKFYEGLLKLNAADIPLHYYYTPTKNISTPATVDPLHMSVDYTSMGGMDMDTKYGSFSIYINLCTEDFLYYSRNVFGWDICCSFDNGYY